MLCTIRSGLAARDKPKGEKAQDPGSVRELGFGEGFWDLKGISSWFGSALKRTRTPSHIVSSSFFPSVARGTPSSLGLLHRGSR